MMRRDFFFYVGFSVYFGFVCVCGGSCRWRWVVRLNVVVNVYMENGQRNMDKSAEFFDISHTLKT